MVGESTAPAQAPERGFVDVKAERRFLTFFGLELNEAAIGHEFVDHRRRMLCVERFLCAQGWDEYMCALGDDAGNMPAEHAEIAALHPQFLDFNQLEIIRAVVELEAIEHATGREVGRVISLGRDRTIRGLAQILQHGFPGKRPELDVEQGGCAD